MMISVTLIPVKCEMNMTGRKSLRDISWQVDEKTYRADPALSHSTLSRYEREGFNNLDKLFDRIESPSLTFGSAVDAIITGGEEEFNANFMVADFPSLPEAVVQIVRTVFAAYKDKYTDIREIPNNLLITAINGISWNNHWRPDTRANKIKEDGEVYYRLLYMAGDKTVLNTPAYNDVCNTVSKLKNSNATRFYFEADSPFDDNIERLYQLKFKAILNGVPYRCMADELIVFHKEKVVVPIDLKTSSKPEWDFFKSFVEWRYDIQARLYWRIIRHVMDQDPYFKDFKLANYNFIVANKRTLQPLVWKFSNTQAVSTLKYRESSIVLRDPEEIGRELFDYLERRPPVPNGIELNKPNDIVKWIENYDR